MKTVLYARTSSDDQAERGTVAMQLDYAARWAPENDVEIVDRYVDDGVSGMILLADRPAGGQLLRDAPDLRRKGVERVLLYDWSRIARDPCSLWGAVYSLERQHSFRIKSMTQEADTSTPERVLLLCLQAGIVSYEREKFLERSRNASDMLARQGCWLGGIAPFGYVVVGERRESRLAPSDAPIEAIGMSEADVIRQMFRWTVEEHLSCVQIAERLTRMHVPPVYIRDERLITRGKRMGRTAGGWSSSRVRNLLRGSIYRGEHTYGKRSQREREVIIRQVPALVDDAIWHRAQEVLTEHMAWSPRNGKREYLLRGLIRCDLCGRTFQGCHQASGSYSHRYYTCGGKLGARWEHEERVRCGARAIAATLEELVWGDVEGFLRDPGETLRAITAQQEAGHGETARLEGELRRLTLLGESRAGETERMLALYRRGRIDEAALDRQLDAIAGESAALAYEQKRVTELLAGERTAAGLLASAEAGLRHLAELLAEGVDFDGRRRLVELLVEGIRVETIAADDGTRSAIVTVTYGFPSGLQSAAPCMDIPAWSNPLQPRLVKVYRTRKGKRGWE